MSNKHNKQHNRSNQPSRLTGSDGPLSVGEVMAADDLPTEENSDPGTLSAGVDPVAEDDVIDDASITGGENVPEAGDDAIQIDLDSPNVPAPIVLSLEEELSQSRAAAMQQVRIKPNVNMRLRMPHPKGTQSMWIQLIAGKHQVVPAYVRDWLYEKGVL